MSNSFHKAIRTALAIGMAIFHAPSVFGDLMLNGAGATFPYPIYSKWFDEYQKKNPGIRINYQSIGSGGGIKQFTAKTVDFGATDGPMTEKELSKVDGKVLHVPTVLGGVVPAYNLPGVEDLKFTGEILANIYLGKIKKWDDPAIQKLNPDAKLPGRPINVVRRSDGSGTTFCFTDYLSSVSSDWDRQVGKGKSVNWPVGLGAKGNEGVAGMIRQIPFSLGYIELNYANQTRMSFGSVQNKAGNFVKASVETVTAAAAEVPMPADFRVSIVNAPGEKSYPISTYTWLLINGQNQGETGEVLKKFITWMATEGQTFAPALDYAPLPEKVQSMVKKVVTEIK